MGEPNGPGDMELRCNGHRAPGRAMDARCVFKEYMISNDMI